MTINVTITATSEKDKEAAGMLRDQLCYFMDDELGVVLRAKGWDGYSGGDDALFTLDNRTVNVKVRNK